MQKTILAEPHLVSVTKIFLEISKYLITTFHNP